MGNYKTADDVKVSATKDDDSDVWEIEFPDGEVRYCHDSAFTDNFQKV